MKRYVRNVPKPVVTLTKVVPFTYLPYLPQKVQKRKVREDAAKAAFNSGSKKVGIPVYVWRRGRAVLRRTKAFTLREL